MVTRRRSVPSGAPSVVNPGHSRNPLPTPPASNQQQAPTQSSSVLLSQVDALARMTFELNLRTVSVQADRLERDLQALVATTAEDKKFRQDYERRLQEMWREILAVKARMAEVQGEQGDVRTEFERCRAATEETLKQFRQESSELRDLVESISTQMDQVSSANGLNHELANHMSMSTRTESTDDRDIGRVRAWADHASRQQLAPACSSPGTDKRRRIKEALNSTRRWNRDHKTTGLEDSRFTVNYLRQQSKRDPTMAVFIQKGIQKRIRRRLSRSASRPESLEEFCQDVTWGDVIETVEDVLVRGEKQAIKTLR